MLSLTPYNVAAFGGGLSPFAKLKATVKALGGALFLPDVNTCWQDVGKTTPCAYDTKVAHMDDVTGLFTATQSTTNYRPYLRSADYSDLPFTSQTGEKWEVTRPSALVADAGGFEWVNGEAYWRNPAGLVANYVSTPDSAAASIPGDHTLVAKIQAVNYTQPLANGIISNRIDGTTGEYSLYITSEGLMRIAWYASGVIQIGSSSIPVPFTNGSDGWVRVRVDRGATATFETSLDGATWSQLGSVVDISALLAPTETTNRVAVGTLLAGGGAFTGKIYYAAAWGNATGEGTPAWEFHPTRDAVKPASPWLEGDGIQTSMIVSIQPGLYGSGYVCAGAVQTEAIGGTNAILGSAVGAERGISLLVNAAGRCEGSRSDGTTFTRVAPVDVLAEKSPFLVSYAYTIAAASVQVNASVKTTSATTRDYTGSTNYAYLFATNNGGPAAAYLQGHIHAFAWTQAIPTDAQDAAIQRFIAQRTGVTL